MMKSITLPPTRIFVAIIAGYAFLALADTSAAAGGGEVLYNGIRLPQQWPPRLEKLDREVMPVPYLQDPPEVIPIDLGRQLLVDDFLIEQTTLKRTFHQARYHPASPVLKADSPADREGAKPTAMVFSDGVWYDPADKLFKMWYLCGYCVATGYATSKDGIHWAKPSLDVVPGTNIVQKQRRDSATVWLDLFEQDPAKRYKLFTTMLPKGGGSWGLGLFCSADGIHWGDPVAISWTIGDRSTVFYNPFRKVWVYSIRSGFSGVGRARSYREHPDAAKGLKLTGKDVYFWTNADRLDPHNPNEDLAKIPPQLYNLDCVAYESLMIGLFSIWQGDRRVTSKRNEVLLGFSRDGFHWDRPDRRPFAGVNETDGAWNWGNVQSAGGGCLVVGDKLYFYVSGRAKDRAPGPNTTGLATIRRDGFASMDAGAEKGVLTTRPVRFAGKYLFVNVDAHNGELRAEVLDQNGQPIEPFTEANCLPLGVDKTLAQMKWNGAEDLSAVSGKPVKLRFYLKSGSLYSFWVTPDASGASHGHVAAGGPGFTGPTDTVGIRAYRTANRVIRIGNARPLVE